MKKIIIVAGLVMLSSLQLIAQKAEVFNTNGQAIRGYDAVAYFTEGKPVKGDEKFVYNWKNANWYFSSKQNLDSFKINPEKFAPQYGGYCAYGMSQGHKAPTDADAWTIVDGKLYFNYNVKVREMWRKNTSEKIEIADKNWPGLKDKE
jgi:YHS domain-containing protein